MPATYKRIVLQERPIADIEPNTFRTETHELSKLNPGPHEVLIQTTWLSLDPAMRGYIRDVRSYLPPVKIGETMRAQGLGIVVKTGKDSALSVGQLVSGAFGWTEYAVMKDKHVEKVMYARPERVDCCLPPVVSRRASRILTSSTPSAPQARYLPIRFPCLIAGAGLTAYFGVHDICQVKPGETMVVSGAAGSVGVVACQLGKRAGAKVYAIAGSQEKCEWLEKEIGVDRAFNYKSKTFYKEFKEIGLVDVVFENVGGDLLDMVLTRLNKDARVALCGAISQYNAAKPKGLKNYLVLISMRAKIQGFIILDYANRFPKGIAELAKGIADGSIKRKFHIVEGLEQAPAVLPWLYEGKNDGKLLVKVSDASKTKL
ncbi:PKS-ER domain-containing protein [Mycena kentingensis (nom. inval.)]|nr:PKS-ER domain-containing protein [Mycena kentingensis (nom. inval.)]